MSKDTDFFEEVVSSGFSIAVMILIMVAVLTFGGYHIYKWSSPAYEEVRHETFENSTAHIDGTIKAINRYRMDYELADKRHRPAIARMARTEAATIEPDKLPADLKEWLDTLTSAETEQ